MDQSQDPNLPPTSQAGLSDAPMDPPEEVGLAGPSSTQPPRTRMLLACDRCRQRKTRCDSNLPSCNACLQAGVPCMTAERDRPLRASTRTLPRDYVERLQNQVNDLEAQYQALLQQESTINSAHLMVGHPTVSVESAPGSWVPPPPNPPPANRPPDSASISDLRVPTHDPLSFGATLFEAIKLSGCDPLRAESPNILFGSLSASLNHVKALDLLKSMDLQSLNAAVNNYIHFIHAHYPLHSGEEVRTKFAIMMRPDYQSGPIAPAEELVIYLVVILGMTTAPQFRSVQLFPQMLYYSALRTPGLFDNLDSIAMTQALILIAVYSLYDPAAGSSWHILNVVSSHCLSMGWHLISSSLGNGIEGTARGWAFWTLYSLDRMAGASMGRPFTIANDDLITVPVPGMRTPGPSDDTGYLSGPLISYYQLLYRACRNPEAGFAHWSSEFDEWCTSTKNGVNKYISAAPRADDWINSMYKYIDLVYYQGHLLIPQFNTEFPTITPEIHELYTSELMYRASKMVGLSFGVHRYPLAWTAGYKAFTTGMSYLFCVTLRDRSTINMPEIHHVCTACINLIEVLAAKFDGLAVYARVLVRGVDMMLRLYNVEGRNSVSPPYFSPIKVTCELRETNEVSQPIANDPYFLYTPYSDAIPRSPNSGVPWPPDVADLHVRRFRCLSRLYLRAMENIRLEYFPDTKDVYETVGEVAVGM
ncbi:uncharacterized protein DFL_006468 [Arthrobotrys flagrans]|uniref:Zn(2)-C6 fungal-type domain-containing protein n=1 Tax=Arthrobotrys flagrans TaxID=97331 RepID=A0A437A142_ARTFL|nr:hypothetical protein DFL_006468 [Arthrobotrys flagrans]